MEQVQRYAVFGHPIKHSQSPKIHRLFAEQTNQNNMIYTAQDVAAENFVDVVHEFFAGDGQGLNCTVPLKELAWSIADERSDRARLSKAANTLALSQDGRLFADNTDGVGLVQDLTVNLQLQLKNINVLILGAGGAARGIVGPLLAESPAQLVIANRTNAKAENLAQEFNAYGPVFSQKIVDLNGSVFDLILNATSASLNNELPDLPDSILSGSGVCYDLVYGLQPTAFVRWGLQVGAARSVDGLGMLVEQAAEAFAIWRGVRPQTSNVIQTLNADRTAVS